MVTEYGMSDKLDLFNMKETIKSLSVVIMVKTKAYSEQVAFEIDQEVRRILMDAHTKAHEIIEAHREQHKLIAENY